MTNAIVFLAVLAAAVYLTPSKWKCKDKCANCGRYYTFYCRKNNHCSCFAKNSTGAVCGMYYAGDEK